MRAQSWWADVTVPDLEKQVITTQLASNEEVKVWGKDAPLIEAYKIIWVS